MSVDTMSIEQLRGALKRRKAQETLEFLYVGFDTAKSRLAGTTSLEDLMDYCRSLAVKYDNARRVLKSS